MDDRRERIEKIRAEIERELAEGKSLDPADWARRHPDLQRELGELLAWLSAGALTIGVPPADPSVAPPDPNATTALAGPTADESFAADPNATTALAPPSPSQSGADPSAETVGIPLGPHGDPGDPLARTTPIGETQAFGHLASWTTMEDPQAQQGSPPTTDRPEGPPQPGHKVRYIGDYELLSVLGRGGMGIVFRAKQLSLNRQVALKMISSSEFATEEQVRRFQNEAESVATLDHPGIVPIYEVGSYQDQRYFSMKLIDGKGMDKALAQLKADPREAARIVAEICDAVHHAHQRGILHRDLKPANVLLDREKTPHVTDFGLAKKIEAEDGMTVSGSVLGTPAYMSPEQASGQISAITTSSDVYGIGAILFATLTQRAPFVGDSLMLTLDRVRNNPPDAPHRLNPGVPRDLEVICLKCLEKEPRRRYASAAELGADLRRWLKGEPIAARPVGPAVRLWMLAKRKPALAGLTAALILASIVGIAGIVWQWREAVYQRDRAQIAEGDAVREAGIARDAEKAAQASERVAVAAKADAEKNATLAGMQAALALDTIQRVLAKVIYDTANRPDLFEFRADIFNLALQNLGQVDQIYKGVTNKEAATLVAKIALGQIYRQIGQIERAVAIFNDCLPLARDRIKIKNNNSASRRNLARVYRQLAGCAEELDRDMNAVVANTLEALKIEEDILAHPTFDDPNLNATTSRLVLADVHTELGVAYHHLGEIDKALEQFRQAFNLRGEVLARLKENPASIKQFALTARGTVEDPGATRARLIRFIAQSELAMADCSARLGRRNVAEDVFRQALEHVEDAAKVEPVVTYTKISFANYHAARGMFHFRARELEPSRKHFEASRDLFAELSKADPKDVYIRREFFAATLRLAQLAAVEKKAELSRKEYDEAYRLAQEIFLIDEKNDLRRIELMLILPHVGQVDRAINMANTLAAGPKVDPELCTYLARTFTQSAVTLPPDKAEQAQTLLVQAMAQLQKAKDKGFRDRAVLETEPDLEPLRNRQDFKDLLKDFPAPG